MERRQVLLGVTTVVSGAAGCMSAVEGTPTETTGISNPTGTPTETPSPDTPSPPYQATLINNTGEKINALVEVRIPSTEEKIWENTYELEKEEMKEVEIDVEPDKYELWAAMPDGPVESIFIHDWRAGREPSVTVRYYSSDVTFE